MKDIEAIRKDLNLITLAEQAGAELRFQHGEWRSACPIHHGENKSGFAIYESKGRLHWKCFTRDCNERGNGSDEFAFLMALNGQTFAEVLKDLQTPGQPIAQPKPPTPEELARRMERIEKELQETKRRLSEIEKWKERQPWQQYHDNAPEWAATEWERAGIPEYWQGFWKLGATESFDYLGNDGHYDTTPTLTIPVFDEKYQSCSTVRHRLLRPSDPGDKYRPDMAGLGAHPFLADPDLCYDVAAQTLVVEGEKKAMVTFLTLDQPGLQVIGIPGKGIGRDVSQRLKGQNVIIALDPDAQKEAYQMARDIGGARVVEYNRKIDDTIIQYNLDRQWVVGLLKTARFVK